MEEDRNRNARAQPASVADDDETDLVIERDPRFIEECRAIHERMHAGEYLTHEQALAELNEPT